MILQTYCVADLKDWLLHNHPRKGLSSAVIAPARAYSIMNNPFVTDETCVVCALFVNEQLVAYTAAFPEVLQKPENRLAWWFSTLWCDPAYTGRGFGLVVVGSLCELIGEGNFFDAEGARETVEIFKMLGLNSVYVPRYVFGGKRIHTDTIRGRLAWCIEIINQKTCARKRKSLWKSFRKPKRYFVSYSRFVDDETYAFMEAHSGKDVILRKKEMLNWILQYPFVQCSPLKDRVPFDNAFSSVVDDYQSLLLHIYEEKELVGVALLVCSNRSLSVKYLYYSMESIETVFDALVEHILSIDVVSFQTNDGKLADFLRPLRLFTVFEVSQRSFSFPNDFEMFDGGTLQAGEGDMFV